MGVRRIPLDLFDGRKRAPPGNLAKKFARGGLVSGNPMPMGGRTLPASSMASKARYPDFDPRSYRCANLSTLVENSGGFDIRKERSAVHVRRKVGARKGSGGGKVSAA